MSDHLPPERPWHSAASGRPTADARAEARRAADAGFSAFYRATQPGLIGFLLNHGTSLTVAADIAQDTMIKAYQRWGELTRPRAWVHTVASKALIRHVTEVREEPIDPTPEPTALLPRPEDAAAWEERQVLQQVLRRLPHRQRQVLAWTFSGYTPAEIAEQLGLTPNAVSASLAKARKAAAEHLTALGYFTTGEDA